MNRLKKLLYVFILLFLEDMYVSAQNMVPAIIVELSSGKKVEFLLADKPKIVFDGQTIKLTANGIYIEYTPTEFVKVSTGEIQSNDSGIEELIPHHENIVVEAEFICLKGFNSGDTVRIYSVEGNLTALYQISTNGSISIPISTLPSDVFIIKTNKQSIKMIKK